MKDFRLTLISDPTDEHPQNKTNSFKVRLPVRLNLEGNTWQASLWSLSVPDVGHSSAVIHSNSDTSAQVHECSSALWDITKTATTC